MYVSKKYIPGDKYCFIRKNKKKIAYTKKKSTIKDFSILKKKGCL